MEQQPKTLDEVTIPVMRLNTLSPLEEWQKEKIKELGLGVFRKIGEEYIRMNEEEIKKIIFNDCTYTTVVIEGDQEISFSGGSLDNVWLSDNRFPIITFGQDKKHPLELGDKHYLKKKKKS